MTQYETLMEIRKMYHEKDEELNKVRELQRELKTNAKPIEDYDFSWIEETEKQTRIQRDCIEYVACRIFPDVDINFWNEIY